MTSPYLSQHGLGERGLHEDLDDVPPGDEAVVVRVRLLKKVLVPGPVSRGNRPLHLWLEDKATADINAQYVPDTPITP